MVSIDYRFGALVGRTRPGQAPFRALLPGRKRAPGIVPVSTTFLVACFRRAELCKALTASGLIFRPKSRKSAKFKGAECLLWVAGLNRRPPRPPGGNDRPKPRLLPPRRAAPGGPGGVFQADPAARARNIRSPKRALSTRRGGLPVLGGPQHRLGTGTEGSVEVRGANRRPVARQRQAFGEIVRSSAVARR